MRRLRRLLTGVCLAALLATVVIPAGVQAEDAQQASETDVEAKIGNGITIVSEDNRVPTFEAGKSTTWTLIVHNNSGADLNNALLSPSLGEKNEEWPFNTEYQSYTRELNIKNGDSQAVSFEFTQREDVPTSRHTLQYNLYAKEARMQLFRRNSMLIPRQNRQKCHSLQPITT